MDISLVNPYIRLAIPSVISAGHTVRKRVIYDYELIYVECGEFTLVYNGAPYHCKKGDFVFICPGVSHSFHIGNGEVSQPHIHFDITHRPHSDKIPISFKDITDMTDLEKSRIHKNYFHAYDNSPKIKIQAKEDFGELFYKIISNETDALLKKAYLIHLISIIINDNFFGVIEKHTCSDVSAQIKDYIDAGNGFGMKLEDFEKIFFQSKFYLEKKFKNNFGEGIIEYRNKKRMEFAPYLLKDYSVSKVSEMLGYQSIYSFSRAYKQFYGFSPSKHAEK